MNETNQNYDSHHDTSEEAKPNSSNNRRISGRRLKNKKDRHKWRVSEIVHICNAKQCLQMKK